MDRDSLTKRLANLRAGEAALQATIARSGHDLAATQGAIAECEHWLAQLPADETESESYPKLSPSTTG